MMRFRVIKSSNLMAADPDNYDAPASPFIDGAKVVKLEDWDYPEFVQYIEVDTLKDLIEISINHGKLVIHPFKIGIDSGLKIEDVPTLEIYDSYRE